MRSLQFIIISVIIFLCNITAGFAIDLKFGWKLPAQATVTSTNIDKRGKVIATFELKARSINETQILVEFFNAEIVEINGRSAADFKLPATTKALLNAIPSYIVNKSTAQVEKIVGWDEMVNKVLSGIPSEAEKEHVSKIFKSPQFSKAIKVKSTETWSLMVGEWVGLQLTKSKPKSISYKIPMGNIKIPTKATYLLEDYPKLPGSVKLSLVRKQEIPSEFYTNIIPKILPGASKNKPKTGNMTGTKMAKVTTVHHPASLYPFFILMEEITEVSEEGKKPKIQKIIKSLRFKWKTDK